MERAENVNAISNRADILPLTDESRQNVARYDNAGLYRSYCLIQKLETNDQEMGVARCGIPAICLLMLLVPSWAVAQPKNIPRAIYEDPAIDPAYPASQSYLHFSSQGSEVNGLIYRPAGAGPHPTIILLHGLPSYDGNLDLARTLQRDGWTVMTFHYRGLWGSAGAFTLGGGVADAHALLDQIEIPANAKAWGVNPGCVVVIGHSYGGYIAAAIAAASPAVIGAVLIAPWDISYDSRALAAESSRERASDQATMFAGIQRMATGITESSFANDIMHNGPDLNLAKLAVPLREKRLFVLTATRDDPDDQAGSFLTSIKQHGGTQLSVVKMSTDHNFADHRIALEIAILRWLATLPGAPRFK
jgi:pimeloyl-ACP methyl ester carboxylesterase